MRKKILFGLLLLTTAAVTFNSCQKEQSGTANSNYNVKPIPPELARNLAQRVSLTFLQNQNQPQRIGGLTMDIPNRVLGDSILVPDKYGNTALYV